MRTARARARVALEPADALALWTNVERWATFVEGFGHVRELSGRWPEEGERVVWESRPGGRGTVTEKIVERRPDRFATLVFEEALMGRQMLRVAPADGGGAEVELTLEYTLSRWGPLSGLADLLFIRRRQDEALARTLRRFAVEGEEEAGLR